MDIAEEMTKLAMESYKQGGIDFSEGLKEAIGSLEDTLILNLPQIIDLIDNAQKKFEE